MNLLISSPDLRHPQLYYKDGVEVVEPKSVRLQSGEFVKPSQFGTDQFLKILQGLGWSQADLAQFAVDYTKLKLTFVNTFRRTGDPYINHLKNVVLVLLLELEESNPVLTRIAWHHDTIEELLRLNLNGPISHSEGSIIPADDFYTIFFQSQIVSQAVKALTKPPRPKPKREMTEQEKFDYDYHCYQQVLNVPPDIAGYTATVKTADRISNLRTMDADTPERQAAYLFESIQFLSDIAERAGEKAQAVFAAEIDKLKDLLTLQQKADIRPIRYTPYNPTQSVVPGAGSIIIPGGGQVTGAALL